MHTSAPKSLQAANFSSLPDELELSKINVIQLTLSMSRDKLKNVAKPAVTNTLALMYLAIWIANVPIPLEPPCTCSALSPLR